MISVEAGAAVVGLSDAAARGLGQRFGQDAVAGPAKSRLPKTGGKAFVAPPAIGPVLPVISVVRGTGSEWTRLAKFTRSLHGNCITLCFMEEPTHGIRALYTASTVTVYQAYAPRIGLAAASTGRFPAAWKRDRMTWIKPSFLWMMYRCGWGTKSDQETVLAIEVPRDRFEWALRHACLSHYEPELHRDRASWKRQLKSAPARVQWDPERDLHLRPLRYRSLQLGLSGEAAQRYADEWIVAIEDVTSLAREIHTLVRERRLEAAARLLPAERPYPEKDGLLEHLRLPSQAVAAAASTSAP